MAAEKIKDKVEEGRKLLGTGYWVPGRLGETCQRLEDLAESVKGRREEGKSGSGISRNKSSILSLQSSERAGKVGSSRNKYAVRRNKSPKQLPRRGNIIVENKANKENAPAGGIPLGGTTGFD